LERVAGRVAAEAERAYAVIDNRSAHRAVDGLLRALEHPRW
jgi:hypothetical protein